jgi:hypothetical protein
MSQQPENASSNKLTEELAKRLGTVCLIATTAMALALVLPWLAVPVWSRSYLDITLSAVQRVGLAGQLIHSLGQFWDDSRLFSLEMLDGVMTIMIALGAFAFPIIAAGHAAWASAVTFSAKDWDDVRQWRRYAEAGHCGALGAFCFGWLFNINPDVRDASGELGSGLFIFFSASMALLVAGKIGERELNKTIRNALGMVLFLAALGLVLFLFDGPLQRIQTESLSHKG